MYTNLHVASTQRSDQTVILHQYITVYTGSQRPHRLAWWIKPETSPQWPWPRLTRTVNIYCACLGTATIYCLFHWNWSHLLCLSYWNWQQLPCLSDWNRFMGTVCLNWSRLSTSVGLAALPTPVQAWEKSGSYQKLCGAKSLCPLPSSGWSTSPGKTLRSLSCTESPSSLALTYMAEVDMVGEKELDNEEALAWPPEFCCRLFLWRARLFWNHTCPNTLLLALLCTPPCNLYWASLQRQGQSSGDRVCSIWFYLLRWDVLRVITALLRWPRKLPLHFFALTSSSFCCLRIFRARTETLGQ